VRTISIGDETPYSYELCGGTHVSETSEIGTFIITSEGSAAAGIRRIEAVTGRKAYELIKDRFLILKNSADILQSSVNDIYFSVSKLQKENHDLEIQLVQYNKEKAIDDYKTAVKSVVLLDGNSILKMQFENISINILRELADEFRKGFDNGIAIFSNTEADNKVQLIVAVSDGLTKQGFNAGNIARSIANEIGGSGGGRPQLAQAGGKDIEKLKHVFDNINEFIKKN
jgi:alanyl-tRNA synthetase